VTAVTLYAREGCHLCDEARAAILALRDELGAFELSEVDIDADDRLHAAFLERIPVVELDGRIVSELVLDEDALRLAIVAAGTLRQ
jgi:Glutaredoxin-like domain (DUF836)